MPTAAIRTVIAAAAAVGLVAACSKRPDYLSRDDSIDEICSEGLRAFTYDIDQRDESKAATKIPDDAVNAGCHAPVNAWTDYRDKEAKGVRNKAYHLRADAGKTILCCKE